MISGETIGRWVGGGIVAAGSLTGGAAWGLHEVRTIDHQMAGHRNRATELENQYSAARITLDTQLKSIGETCLAEMRPYLKDGPLFAVDEHAEVDYLMRSNTQACGTSIVAIAEAVRPLRESQSQLDHLPGDITAEKISLHDQDQNKLFGPIVIPVFTLVMGGIVTVFGAMAGDGIGGSVGMHRRMRHNRKSGYNSY